MGGRGASSSIAKGTGSLERYLGKKGSPMSVEKALETINPNWQNGEEWQYNCQSCTTSFEATQRGYDVQAVEHAPNTPYFANADGKQHFWYDVYEGEKKGDIYNDAFYKFKEAQQEGNWEKARRYYNQSMGFYGIEGKTKVYNTAGQIEKQMKEFGDGARGTLQVKWKSGGAHIMNILNKGGQVFIADAQSGKTYTVADVLSRAKKGSALTRVDNLKFNSNIQYLTKKGN